MVKEWLGIGRKNAVDRCYLTYHMKQSDREVRRAIEEISETEIPVLNMMDGKGYFIPSSNEAVLVLRWIRVMKSYIRSFERKIKVCEAWYAQNVGQLPIEEE